METASPTLALDLDGTRRTLPGTASRLLVFRAAFSPIRDHHRSVIRSTKAPGGVEALSHIACSHLEGRELFAVPFRRFESLKIAAKIDAGAGMRIARSRVVFEDRWSTSEEDEP